MRKSLCPLFLVVLLHAQAAAGGDILGDSQIAPAIAIRAYSNGVVSVAGIQPALAIAGRILNSAGVEAHWRICEGPRRHVPADACVDPLVGNELAIRFLRQPLSPDRAGLNPLGNSLIDTDTGGGSLATIYLDRIATLAGSSRTSAATLLGRAIAHEIGHLLMGTTTHGPAGLMRAVWSTAELRRDDASDWLFTPREASAMRESLRMR
jgi:hypothetical protein